MTVQPSEPDAAHVPVIAFAGDASRRCETLQLEWPLTVDGEVIDSIIVRRMTVGDVAGWQQRLAAVPEDERASVVLPMLFLPSGAPVTPALAAALDSDDDSRIEEVMSRFLPRFLRRSD